jgi:ABC-2 type transport system permease protein
VLFDNQATAAVARQRPDGRYDVTITARARKLRANGQGVETEVPIDDWIDVGVFGRTARAPAGGTDTVLFLRKQHVTGHDVTVTATVDSLPFRAGIDPYNMLIDRTPGDNVRSVTR